MKKLFKKLAGLMMGLLAVAGLAGFNASKETSVVAKAATINAGTTFYLKPNSNWTQANARFAIYFFNDNENEWVSMSLVRGLDDVYQAQSPNKSYNNLIFCRMNGGTTSNNWSNKWNQTADLTYDGTKNCYSVKDGTWDKDGGDWSEYTPPEAYDLSFVYENKEIADKIAVAENRTIKNLPFVEIEGLRFDGWYVDEALTNPFDKATPITANITLYAKYVEAENYLIYVLDTGNWSNRAFNIHLFGNYGQETNWPGVALNRIDGTNVFYYEIEASKSYTGVVVNNKKNSDDNSYSQTKNIDLTEYAENKCIVIGDCDSKDEGKYFTSMVTTKVTIAHISGESISYNGFENTNLVASATGISVVNLTKEGFAFDADATAALTTEQKQAAFEQYMTNVDTCTSYDNVAEYNKLAEGLDTSVKIEDEDEKNTKIEISIKDKLAYMEVYKASKDAEKGTSGINILGNISSSNNIAIVLVVGLLGLTAVGAYYFINKRKYAK